MDTDPRTAPARPDHWDAHARQWSLIGPPLRPGPDDLAFVAAALGPTPGPCLLLGSTAEYARLAGWTLAVDLNAAMLGGQWRPTGRLALLADWFRLPLAPGRFHAVLGDGSFNTLDWPAGHARLLACLAPLLRPGGLLALRVFTSPVRADSLEALADRARSGRGGGFHAFKWRLAMALARGGNVAVADILAGFEALFPDRDAVGRANGWAPRTMATIDVYRGSPARYSFPRLDELLALARDAGWRPRAAHRSGYELGERCPVLLLEPPA